MPQHEEKCVCPLVDTKPKTCGLIPDLLFPEGESDAESDRREEEGTLLCSRCGHMKKCHAQECDCEADSDFEMERIAKVVDRLLKELHGKGSHVSAKAIVHTLGELEETDHERTCSWYGYLLEACERTLWT